MTYEQAKAKLETYGQGHALKYYDELTEAEQKELLAQIEQTDFAVLKSAKKSGDSDKGVITPIPAMKVEEIEKNREEYTRIGTEAIRAGKVGAVLLAGGMGTRLGSDNPKGMYNVGINKDVYIFECIINNLLDVVKQTGAWVHLFVMTSDKNHESTTAFLKDKNYFGYNPDYITFFMQDMAPASDYDGKVYMESKGKISTSPNGNGGWFSSMDRCGVLKKVRDYGIEWLNIFAVDNVLQRIADPCFIGATIKCDCVVGSKVIKKAAPDEKVGVMCQKDGRPSIVEYYELTDEMKTAVDENGEPAYNFGVILNYLFKEAELEKIMENEMPLHVVEKKVPHIDEDGNQVNPEKPNGFKYETLVLDMINMLRNCLPYEVIREKEFAPIKNKTGVDSVDTARELLKKNGVQL